MGVVDFSLVINKLGKILATCNINAKRLKGSKTKN